MAISKMETNDLTEVVAMGAASSSNPWSRNMFIEEMLNPRSHCFVAKSEEFPEQRIVGFVCFRNVEDESELLNLCVHPQYRRLGVARKLMEFYINFSTPIRTFYLEVDSLNHSAIHLYELLLYKPVGIRKKFYRGESDALLMAKGS